MKGISKGLKGLSAKGEYDTRKEEAIRRHNMGELTKEFESHRGTLKDRADILGYNRDARQREIGTRQAAEAEGMIGETAARAADQIRPQQSTSWDDFKTPYASRIMAGQDELLTTDPLTGGSQWANAVASEKSRQMLRSQDFANDLGATLSGQRNDIMMQQASEMANAITSGLHPMLQAGAKDAKQAGARVDDRVRDAEMGNITKPSAKLRYDYGKWLGTPVVTKKGSLGGIADAMSALLPAESSAPSVGAGRAPTYGVGTFRSGFGGGGSRGYVGGF